MVCVACQLSLGGVCERHLDEALEALIDLAVVAAVLDGGLPLGGDGRGSPRIIVPPRGETLLGADGRSGVLVIEVIEIIPGHRRG